MESELKVIKIGGHVIDDEYALKRFLKDFARIKNPKILVHGGGKLATRMSQQMGIEVKMLEGRRITTDENLEIVTMVYAGLVNKKICAYLQQFGCNALGLSGADADIMRSAKRPSVPVDYGWVGDVSCVNAEAIQRIIAIGFTPVCCAITHDGAGQLLNTNADTVAAEMAIAGSTFHNTELLYCFEKKGVLANSEDESSVIPEIGYAQYTKLRREGIVQGGMLPKIDNCFDALKRGVHSVKIGGPGLINEEKEEGTKISWSKKEQAYE